MKEKTVYHIWMEDQRKKEMLIFQTYLNPYLKSNLKENMLNEDKILTTFN